MNSEQDLVPGEDVLQYIAYAVRSLYPSALYERTLAWVELVREAKQAKETAHD